MQFRVVKSKFPVRMSHVVNNLNLEEEEEKVRFQRNITYYWLVFLWVQSEPETTYTKMVCCKLRYWSRW